VFAKHLPPSAALPVVLALDPQAEQACDPERVVLAAADAVDVDAIVAGAWPESLATLRDRLRPGGRLILLLPGATSDPAEGVAWLDALQAGGFIHCLIESLPEGGWLCRGERPPQAPVAGRLSALAAGGDASRAQALTLLVRQTPNKPTWRLDPGERRIWEAATVIDPATGAPTLLTFTSLVKAVAFMQPAVLAGFLIGINKTGRFSAESVGAFDVPVIVNPAFEDWRNASPGPLLAVEPALALASEE
jgi:hypothetical protein